MRALTICQPYASLIVGWPGMDEAIRKLVENRRWYSTYRGSLLIHAGKSKKYLGSWHGPVPEEMPFGAILGRAILAGCVTPQELALPTYQRWHHLRGHPHIQGPYCLVLTLAQRLNRPIPYQGRQGLFSIPASILAGAMWLPPFPPKVNP